MQPKDRAEQKKKYSFLVKLKIISLDILTRLTGWNLSYLLKPAECVLPPSMTDRELYELEHKLYQVTYNVQRRGEPIRDRKSYEIYCMIAEKYHWLYIKEQPSNYH